MTKNDASRLALHRARPRDLFPVVHRLSACAHAPVVASTREDYRMDWRARVGKWIVKGVMAYYALAWSVFFVIVWGAMAQWKWAFLPAMAAVILALIVGLWALTRAIRMGAPGARWAGILCGGLSALVIMVFTLDTARSLPNPQERAKWEAEFGGRAVGLTLASSAATATCLFFLPAVSCFFRHQRLQLDAAVSLQAGASDRDGEHPT